MFRVGLREQGLWPQILWCVATFVRNITGAPMVTLSRITPQLHVGGQYRQRGWPSLAARGITAVIDMRAESSADNTASPAARHLHLPTVDDETPTLEQLREGIDFIAAEIAQGGGVYVHCHSGVGRGPTMVAAYLVSTGLAPEQAWALIQAVRPFVYPSPAQAAEVERFAIRLGTGAFD